MPRRPARSGGARHELQLQAEPAAGPMTGFISLRMRCLSSCLSLRMRKMLPRCCSSQAGLSAFD